MGIVIKAACGCNKGKIRKNNEDNFCFAGRCLEKENNGLRHPVTFESSNNNGLMFAVFDGMGGENFGELASYTAARELQQIIKNSSDFFVSEKDYLDKITKQLNDKVNQKKEEQLTKHMGTTMVSLYFSNKNVYVCDVGDSRAYRLRNGEFLQLSEDHIAKTPSGNKKAPLIQYLGFDSEGVELEPYIARCEINNDDIYLICSDGLTDMLTNFEICDIVLQSDSLENSVENLIQAALDHGGNDNITIIMCKVVSE